MSGLRSLHSGFLRSAECVPDRPALEVAGQTLTYAELRDRAASLAATIDRHHPGGGSEMVGLFAYRSPTAFAGVLGTLCSGRAYVPINRTFPTDRSRVMVQRCGTRVLIIDAESAGQLDQLLVEATDPMLLILPDHDDVTDVAGRHAGHTVLGAGELEPASAWEEREAEPASLAYLLFTSGSTGTPKGVMVEHRNIRHYIDRMGERFSLTEEDRCSQCFEMTFDVSVFDMFVCWDAGACLCCPSQKTLIKPGRFIRDSRLTLWYSAPSLAILMKRFGMLKPDSYPTLRYSLFAGEALPAEMVRAWEQAAPGSVIENQYGPTEVSIVCVLYRWDPETSPAECEQGVVPIGHAVEGLGLLVADPDLGEVEPGGEGELLVRGPQVTPGYWEDPGKTAAAFVVPPGRDEVHYRTGDRVRRPATEGAPVTYLGRLDHQIKVRGVRIELGEVEAVLREESGVDSVVAVGWPRRVGGADGIEAFIGEEALDAEQIRARIEARLPGQMVPRHIHLLPELPLNANGKFDRPALLARLETEAAK